MLMSKVVTTLLSLMQELPSPSTDNSCKQYVILNSLGMRLIWRSKIKEKAFRAFQAQLLH